MHFLKRSLPVLVLTVAVSANSYAQTTPPGMKKWIKPEWTKEIKPFRMAGNLYYVGTEDLTSYLITTPEGHILINTGIAESAPIIKKNIAKLGFRYSDIKILANSQAHFDHVGAMAQIKKETGAKVYINEYDAPVIADGGKSDYAMGGEHELFDPFKADVILHKRDTISLGGTKVIAIHHPGHTHGSTAFLFDVKDDKNTYRVLIANMPTILSEVNLKGMPGYANVGKDFAFTIADMKKQQFDLWMAAHGSQFDLDKKHKDSDGYNPKAFADRKGYDAAIKKLEADYNKRLKETK